MRRDHTALVLEPSRGAVRRFHEGGTGGCSRRAHREAEALGLLTYRPGTALLGEQGLPAGTTVA